MDGDRFIVVDRLGAIMLDVGGLVVVDGLGAVVTDPVGLVVLDLDVLILLGVEPELLGAFLILEADGVGVRAGATLAGAGQQARLCHVGRQVPRRHLVAVIDPAGNDRLVRVALQEINDDLLADARDHHAAPILAGPGLSDPHPAGTGLVGLAVAVPVELHLDPSVFVGPDLLAGFADDDSGLRTPHCGFRGGARRPVGDLGIHGAEVARKDRTRRR